MHKDMKQMITKANNPNKTLKEQNLVYNFS